MNLLGEIEEPLDSLDAQAAHYAAKLTTQTDPAARRIIADRIDRILDARLRLTRSE